MIAEWLLPAMLTGAVAIGWARLGWWHYRAAASLRSRWWRVAALVLLQPICAALLYLTLVPPALPTRSGTLVVATTGSGRVIATSSDERLVALPEATQARAERLPDLATALRRYPGTARLRIVGDGLVPRDRDSARTRSLAFDSSAAPRGLIAVAAPAPVAPGAGFQVGGQVAGIRAATIELIDPAGQRVDARRPADDGTFSLSGTAREAGAVTFALRALDDARTVVASAVVPVETIAAPPPMLLVLAGAPGPEIKYLRRWATEAGVPLNVQLALGGGMALGDAPIALNGATLARFDAVVVDERSWASAGAAGQGALRGAVRGGLGLVLRITGPLPDAVRRQWQGFGLALTSGGQVATVSLPEPAIDPAALRARRGPGSGDRSLAADTLAEDPPVLTRRATPLAGATVVPVVRDAKGAVLAAWRPLGRGRVAVWNLPDSFALVLTGQGERYGEYWSDTLSAVARAGGTVTPRVTAPAWAGERVTICALPPGASVTGPDGTSRALIVGSDGCAGFWPRQPGWHEVAPGGARFFVQSSTAVPAMRAEELRAATLALVGERPAPARATSPAGRGTSWPWALAWLITTAGLWWFERARVGRVAGASAAG